jgi:myo-inositol 2-dehydrogenase/D-chiro-inositol 1-dehydrogenase
MVLNADLDALYLVTSSSLHAAQIIAGLEAGLHVFCEKPMGVNVAECVAVEKAVARHPDKVFFIGFVRRFDPSYADAKRMVESGVVGEPFLVRSQTADLDEYAPFQAGFVKTSGGIFLDMNVHDVDLARWFLGAEAESVYATGGSYVHGEFASLGDADNTEAIVKFRGGKMAVIAASRTAFHGHDTWTEIKGSKGILRIGAVGNRNRVEILDAAGARRDCVTDFYERFEAAFAAEAQEFADCVREGRKPAVSAADGTRATEIGFALTESFRRGEVVKL